MGRKKNPDPLYWEKRRARPERRVYTCAWCELTACGQTWRVCDGQHWHADCRAEYETLLPMTPAERVTWWHQQHPQTGYFVSIHKARLIEDAEAAVAADVQRQAHLAIRDFWLKPHHKE